MASPAYAREMLKKSQKEPVTESSKLSKASKIRKRPINNKVGEYLVKVIGEEEHNKFAS